MSLGVSLPSSDRKCFKNLFKGRDRGKKERKRTKDTDTILSALRGGDVTGELYLLLGTKNVYKNIDSEAYYAEKGRGKERTTKTLQISEKDRCHLGLAYSNAKVLKEKSVQKLKTGRNTENR